MIALTLIALSLAAALLAGEPRPAPHMPESGGKDGRIHLQLDRDVTFGVGGQMAMGANTGLTASLAVWDAGRATGAFEFGTMFRYSNEPTWLAPWIDRTKIEGSNHRIDWVATAGHGFWMGKRRRFYLGTHLYAGWNYWLSQYKVRYPDEAVSGSAKIARSHVAVGAQLGFAYRFSKRWGIHVLVGGPFPTASSYAIGLVFGGIGLTLHLR